MYLSWFFKISANLVSIPTSLFEMTGNNLSGGHVEYYNYSMDPITVNANYEKLHFDLTRIFFRKYTLPNIRRNRNLEYQNNY